ncbi:MAG: hypothetical protein KKA10_06800, partial [Euryarchaeota archaeon]|nr:hypothetical protein [Euryarchaeota archaeon]
MSTKISRKNFWKRSLPALLEDPVHSRDSYITYKIFNSGSNMSQGNHPASKPAPRKKRAYLSRRRPPQTQPSYVC